MTHTVIIFAILALIILYFATRREKPLEVKVVKAGGRKDSCPASVNVAGLSDKMFLFGDTQVNADKYEKFIVSGDSMQSFDIEANSGLLVSVFDDKENVRLEKYQTLIFEIKEDDRKAREVKLRKYLSDVDLSKTTDDIYAEQVTVYSKLSKLNERQQFMDKLKKAKARFPNQTVSLSLTYKDGKLDYSFHTWDELYGKVEYVIPPKYIKICK